MTTKRHLALLTGVAFATGALLVPPSAHAADEHVLVPADEVEWQPGPASVPEGMEFAVLYGDPSQEGLFAMRLKFPAGYHLPPHTHPRPEVVTVISGTFHYGMGEEADREKTEPLPTGSFLVFPPGMAHFVYTDEETVVQLNSIGPWGIDYVDPADDPRS